MILTARSRSGARCRFEDMNARTRGYALLVVLLFGVVLASMSSLLLYATMRDNSEARQQVSSARAVYAAEGGVAPMT